MQPLGHQIGNFGEQLIGPDRLDEVVACALAQTPDPIGLIGHSSALVNVFWGLFNVIVGLVLVDKAPITIGMNEGFIAAIAGAVSLGVFVALHFGKFAWRDTK